MYKTHIAFCIDESGSIRGIKNALVDSYNANMESIKFDILDQGQEATMTALLFGHINMKHRVLYHGKQVQTVEKMKYSDIDPSGRTPLFDSVYRAIEKLEELDDGEPETSLIISTITDGEENDSRNPGIKATLKKMQEKIATDRWTFTFLVPKGQKNRFCKDYAIPYGNVLEWEATSSKGTTQAFKSNASAYANFFKSKSTGVRSTTSFYTDLSNVSQYDISNNLEDITNNIQIFVNRDTKDIKSVIEEHNKTYYPGSSFYELTKREKAVQDYKRIIIKNKSTGHYYTGDMVRSILGLTSTGTVSIVPGNHGDYEIYIQSTSWNRKVLAGTRVIYWWPQQ